MTSEANTIDRPWNTVEGTNAENNPTLPDDDRIC
jgi:hypothetical protein